MVPDRVRLHHYRIMTELSDRLAILVWKTIQIFDTYSDEETSKPSIAGGWSRKQIIGHLIDSASNNHQRFVRALLQDEIHLPTYDQQGNVRVQRYQELPWGQLIGLWESYNRFLAHVLAGVPKAKLNTPCFIGNNPEMTLEELAEDYIRHMQHHLDQCVTTP
jgi:DinB superfamily